MRSAVVPSDSRGAFRITYQKYVSTLSGWRKDLLSRWFNPVANGTVQVIDTNIMDTADFSAMSDLNYGVHVLYRTNVDGSTDYAYLAPGASSWTPSQGIFNGRSFSSPTLTVDYSTNTVYAFAIDGTSIVMEDKAQNWADSSMVFPVIARTSPAYLGSNFASASDASSSQIELIWTEGLTVVFASIPIQTVWSPYSTPRDPWDGNGLAPFGQYFANLGESVSPFTGMLALKQTDLSVPGRSLNLDFTRVYTEPYSFLSGPYNYENYPWASIGNGWQLNFPWMNTGSKPSFIHLWSGEGYRIPSSFWNNLPTVFENHQGENFRMIRNSTDVYLYDPQGVAYVFDPTHSNRLITIVDPVGNLIQIGYNPQNQIGSVTDSVLRIFQFCYNAGFLASINQTSGNCASNTGSIRGIVFKYNGPDLTSVYDPEGRITSYTYNSFGSGSSVIPWLLSGITYPTGGYTNYTFLPFLMGTEAQSYRVTKQYVGTNDPNNPKVREFDYNYADGTGDQVNNSTVTAYDGNSGQPVSYTSYSFSFAGTTWNITDGNHKFVGGEQQRFGVHGEVPREIVLVSPTQSYSNFYRYDLWGNQIYSRKVINPSANWYHEAFNAYYNDGLPPGFRAFQETFSQNQGNASENPWFGSAGDWTVSNGVYNGTSVNGTPTSTFSWANFTTGDVSVQARVYLARQINSTAQAGIFGHYLGTRTEKWSLDLLPLGPNLAEIALLDDDNSLSFAASTSCSLSRVLNSWYTFNVTFHGSTGTGWVWRDGQPAACPTITGQFSQFSAVTYATAFGVLSGGFSTLFDNVTVATVSPLITTAAFSNSFYNGAPGPNIHTALAGTAELQNKTNPVPLESYDRYYSWGGLSQTKQLYNPTAPSWLTTSRTYDNFGNPYQFIDSRGNTTTFTFSGTYQHAYLTSQTQTLKPGNTPVTDSYGYNFALGTRTSTVDAMGYNTTYQYDILGRTTRMTYPNGDFTSYSYNDQSNYVEITNENGWDTVQQYDGLGRLLSKDRRLNGSQYSVESYAYNWMDKIATNTDPIGHTYTYQYDVLGRIVRVMAPDGNFTQQIYNDTSPFVETLDQSGVVKFSLYDRQGRLVQMIEEQNNSLAQCPGVYLCYTYYYYDEVGNLRLMKTSQGTQSTSYSYDSLNRLTATTYPDTTSESYSYDNNGNVVSRVDRSSTRTTYRYDSLNRLTNITYYGTRTNRDNYTYSADGELVILASQNATIQMGYDWRNRLTDEYYYVNWVWSSGGAGGCGPVLAKGTQGRPCGPVSMSASSSSVSPLSTPSGTVSTSYAIHYSYSGENLADLMYPASYTVAYSYDSLGRVMNVSQLGSTGYYAKFTYYANDQINTTTYGNGVVSTYAYDALARVRSISTRTSSNNQLMLLNYAYNKSGTVATVTGKVGTATISEQYRYDSLGRLTNSILGTTTLFYQYDRVGNRVSQTANNVATQYSYTASNNELQSATTNSVTTNYAYDGDGRLISRNVGSSHWTFAWDVPGNLLKASNDSGVQGFYAYDGQGRRLESKEGSTTTFFAYSGTNVIYESTPWPTMVDYVWSAGMRIAKVTPALSYYITDALGSTRLVIDSTSNANILFSDSYQPFGQDNGTPTGSESNKFTGKPVSQTTGLYYEFSRWYDPSIGRFISQDPLAGHLSDPQSLNPYIYATDQPTGITDPSGMDGCGIFSSVCSFVSSGATTAWNGLTTVGSGIENGWNGLSPEEQQGLMLAGFVALTFATGGTDLLVIGGIGAVAAVGGYLGGTYAAGGTPTLAGALMWANVGFGVTTGIDSLAELGAGGGLNVAERLAANRAAGLGYEGQIADALGFTRNIGIGRTVLQGTKTAGSAVPDFVTDTFIGEAKFTQSTVYATRQIRTEIEGAAQAGKAFNIFVPEGTGVADSVFRWGVKFGVSVTKVPFP